MEGSKAYVTLAENQEFVNHFFDNKLLELLNPNPNAKKGNNFDPKCIEMIHISDRKTFSNEPMAMKIVFVLPSENKMAQTQFYTEFVLKQIEKIMAYRPSQKSKLDSQNARNALNFKTEEDKEKDEEKLEKLREAKQDKYDKMSVAEKQKYDEKQEKRFKSRYQKKLKMK